MCDALSYPSIAAATVVVCPARLLLQSTIDSAITQLERRLCSVLRNGIPLSGCGAPGLAPHQSEQLWRVLWPKQRKARAIGVNHVALEVGDIEEALAFYGRLFEFTLRGKSENAAFIDLGDQFLALQRGRKQPGDDGRHFGLVVDDKEVVREALKAADVQVLPGRFLDFLDPWGNRIEIVGYDNIQFTKAPHVLRAWACPSFAKSDTGGQRS